MSEKPPRVLIIAGSDPSGGAGIQADIKTVTILGGYAMAAVTALTVQNTLGVTTVQPVAADFVAAQIKACLDDIGADSVKIGMLGAPAVAHAIADALDQFEGPIVFDPVMVATSGGILADTATIAAFDRLIARAALVTPNLPELEALGGLDALRARTRAVLVKGGHGEGNTVEDVLHTQGTTHVVRSPRIETRHTHGTGCTLASAIATHLAAGLPLPEATRRGVAFVQSALAAAPGFGAGHGPVGHQAVRDSQSSL